MKALAMLAAIFLIALASAPATAETGGSISGIVTSANNEAVPGAMVTLWAVVDDTPAQAVVPNNPQYTSSFSTPLPGIYAFTGVPPGRYNVTAAWNGYTYYAEVSLVAGTATATVLLAAFVLKRKCP